jgi:poly(3-hydroxybutyrate) depolymerase
LAAAGWGGEAGDAKILGAGGKSTQTGMGGLMALAGAAAADGGGGTGAAAGAAGTASPISGSPGCGTDPPAPAMDTSIQVTGMSASYILDLPANYDKTRSYPLVMAFKGSNTTAEQLRARLNLQAVAGTDAILVYPNCLGDAPSWLATRDVPLFDMLLAQTLARYCVDERRVFAVGQGLGGYFTNVLGCLRGDKLRAVAAFVPGVPPSDTCQGEVAAWIGQGKADTPTAVANGKDTSEFWGKRNGCDTTLSTPVDPSPCQEFAGCHLGFAVRYCPYEGSLDLPPFAASAVWGFFKDL